jgi:predicted lipid-binding transport protein (Tim44 family)
MAKGLIGLCAIVLCGVLVMEDADARGRVGGARSTGVQRSVPNNAPASTPAKPAQQQAAPNQAAGNQTAAPQAQPTGLSRWMPVLGGLALGGLLGYLFAGNGLGGILLLVLLAVGAVLLFRMLARRRAEAPQRMQYAGMDEQATVTAAPPSQASSTEAQSIAWRMPTGFDAASFLRGAKMNFAKLQLANDLGQLDDIREFTTDEMFEELERDIAERRGESQRTDIESLEADLVDLATEGERHWASVRFSGRVRETPGTQPVGFSEVWNLVKPADGSSGWLLAGIQQMH